MRKFDVELNLSKLATKRVQLAHIETRLFEAKLRLETIQRQFNAKELEVTQLDTAIKLAQTPPSVS